MLYLKLSLCKHFTLLTTIFAYGTFCFTYRFNNCNLNLSPNPNNNLNLFPNLKIVTLFFCPIQFCFLLCFVLCLWSSPGPVLVSSLLLGQGVLPHS